MLLKSKQLGIIYRKNHNPSFKITFEDEPVEVSKEVGEYLLERFPNNFEKGKKKIARGELN